MLFNFIKDSYYDIIDIYFTTVPYIIFNKGLKNNNMALNEIGLGLIQCQKIFWFSNVLVIFTIYLYIVNKKYKFINIGLFMIIICLYCINLYKTKKLIKYLKINI